MFDVTVMCAVLEVSRSRFYEWCNRPPTPREAEDARLADRIEQIHQDSNHTFGAPRITAELRFTHGWRVGRKRVARLMRARGLAGASRRPRTPRTTTRDRRQQAPPDLVGRFFAGYDIDRLWMADLSYVPTRQGWLYLAVVLDAASRTVVGWSMADHLRTELPLAALDMALHRRRPAPGAIHHSDLGCQYLAERYQARLVAHGLRPSAGAPGACWDNAVVESFFATLKTETEVRVWPTHRAARTGLYRFIEAFYNQRRRHSALGYLTPAEYDHQQLATLAAA